MSRWSPRKISTSSGEYNSWRGMKARCVQPSHKMFHNYGGRGIVVCPRWQSFDNFIKDMGPKPSPKHSLDRINVNRNYEPGNCRWATPSDQQRNRRHNRKLMVGGRKITVAEIASKFKVSAGAIYSKIERNGIKYTEDVWLAPFLKGIHEKPGKKKCKTKEI